MFYIIAIKNNCLWREQKRKELVILYTKWLLRITSLLKNKFSSNHSEFAG